MQKRKNIKYGLLFISLCLSITNQTILTRDKQDQDKQQSDRRDKRHKKKNRRKENSDSDYKEEGYFENIGERTGTVIEDTGLLAGSILGLGREKKGNDDSKKSRHDKKRESKKDSRTNKKHKEEKRDGYVENVGKRTGNTVKDTGMLAGSFLGLGRDKKDTNSNE